MQHRNVDNISNALNAIDRGEAVRVHAFMKERLKRGKIGSWYRPRFGPESSHVGHRREGSLQDQSVRSRARRTFDQTRDQTRGNACAQTVPPYDKLTLWESSPSCERISDCRSLVWPPTIRSTEAAVINSYNVAAQGWSSQSFIQLHAVMHCDVPCVAMQVENNSLARSLSGQAPTSNDPQGTIHLEKLGTQALVRFAVPVEQAQVTIDPPSPRG
mmetsp:Transcript_18227/g.48975  ORF Transcript_18227/g.48975 Transcript_18227/m.48975 type:complete len:215 (-) Transcript_18227:166-810(-)